MQPDRLTLEEKCRLLGGASTWRTHEIDGVGIPAVKMSDGPNGVRGDGVGASGTAGVVVPVGIALGATWDPHLVGRIGDLLGREAVRKGAHVLLAPTVNLQRTPVGGRVFECYSEDPELTARLAVAFVANVQAHDVAVTVKHFVLNDTEVDRMSVDVRVDERTLRELYLRPFEAAVTEGGAWGVMSAYNRVDGEFSAANRTLLTDILRAEWGFDGFVVSDWLGAHDTAPSALAGLTIPMPGPRTIYGEPLHQTVKNGDVPEPVVDDLVAEVLRLIERTRATERSSERDETTVDDPAERDLCREAVAAGLVLLRNDGVLPLTDAVPIAVVGPNAADTRIMGGGSASLRPLPHRSILAALQDRMTAVVHEPGVRIDKLPPPATADSLRTPSGEAGLLVEYRNGKDFDGPVAFSDIAPTSRLQFFGSTPDGVDEARFNVTMRGTFVPQTTGPHVLSGVLTGAGRMSVADTIVVDDPSRRLPRGEMFFHQGCEEQQVTVDLVAGAPVAVEVRSTGMGGSAGLRLGIRPPDPADLIDRAVTAASAAEVAVVVVGTNDEWETEGHDRTTIALPGDQDELVRRVAAANPRTVVLVNAGSPVAMPWIDDVAAVAVTYFGGIEMADGVVDVLLGERDPGGRLPITYPVRLEDTPAWPHYAPDAGVQHYGEGLHMGYRGFDGSGAAPLFPFGDGLSYGEVEWVDAHAEQTVIAADAGVRIEVVVDSTSDRPTTVVPQCYLVPVDPVVPWPHRSLVAWTKQVVAPRETLALSIDVPPAAFRRWDTDAHVWTVDPGAYDLVVGTSAADTRFRLPLTVTD